MNTGKLLSAIEFATRAHAGQHRKGTDIPYMVHPLRVAKSLSEHGCEEKLVIAGILHDTVEDTPVTLEEITERFGQAISDLVQGLSEHDTSDTWESRKKHTIEHLKSAPEDVLIVACADKLDNITSMKVGLKRVGPQFWERFNRPKEKQKWYYTSLARVLSERLTTDPGKKLAQAVTQIINEVFG